ncbi:hypothetical protein EBZ35_05730 [bacterium]|nr:hypothetical protein [bacterium]
MFVNRHPKNDEIGWVGGNGTWVESECISQYNVFFSLVCVTSPRLGDANTPIMMAPQIITK